MNLTLSEEDLRPIVRAVVTEVLDRVEADRARLAGRLGYSEAEAAALLGVRRHVLADARRRGEIHARKVGQSYRYSRDGLLKFLAEGDG